MAYNLTRHSVMRNKPQLDQILASKGVVRFHTNRPQDLQKNLFEALAAAREFPEFRHYYDKIKPNYTIRARRGYVIVEPKEVLQITKTEVLNEDERFEEVRPEPILPVDAPQSNVIAPDIVAQETNLASTLPEVLLAATQAGNEITDLIFPHANQLSLDEKRKLNEWCKSKSVNFIDQDEKGITLTRRPVDAELLWREE